jgi:hypothetical protein
LGRRDQSGQLGPPVLLVQPVLLALGKPGQLGRRVPLVPLGRLETLGQLGQLGQLALKV